MRALPAVLARGGSSRGLLFTEAALAGMSEAERRAAFAVAVGSPDPDARQVNGVGGGNVTTSKIAVIAPPKSAEHDVDYSFYQVIVATGFSETRGTCGNLVAAVGQFAINSGIVAAREPSTIVRIKDVNTGQTIEAEVPVKDGEAVIDGDLKIAGVPGTGAPIPVRFMAPGGRVTGKLLPTGNLVDKYVVDGVACDISLVDSVNPVVLIHATSLPSDTPWSLVGIESDAKLNAFLEKVRRYAAVRFGLATDEASAGETAGYIPFVGMYWDRGMIGRPVPAAIAPMPEADVVVRLLSGGLPHRAVPLSAGLATATLARLRALEAGAGEGAGRIRLEHPSGLLDIDVDAARGGPVNSVGVTQTARPIMAGDVYIP